MALAEIRKDEIDGIDVAVEQQEQDLAVAGKRGADAFGDRVFPMLGLLLFAVRLEPGYISNERRHGLAVKKAWAAQQLMLRAQRDHAAHEVVEGAVAVADI